LEHVIGSQFQEVVWTVLVALAVIPSNLDVFIRDGRVALDKGVDGLVFVVLLIGRHFDAVPDLEVAHWNIAAVLELDGGVSRKATLFGLGTGRRGGGRIAVCIDQRSEVLDGRSIEFSAA